MLIKCASGYHYNWWPDGSTERNPVGSFDLFDDKKRPDKPLSLWSFGIREEGNRGKGYGQQMLNEAIALAGDRDIELYVMKANEVAIHVYKKAGFEIWGDYYNGGYAMRMVRKAKKYNGSAKQSVCCA